MLGAAKDRPLESNEPPALYLRQAGLSRVNSTRPKEK